MIKVSHSFIVFLISLLPLASYAGGKYYVSQWAGYLGGSVMRISPSATVPEVRISDAFSRLYVGIHEQVTLSGKDSASFAKGEPVTLETNPERVVQFFRDGKDSAQIVVYGPGQSIRMMIYLQRAPKDSP